MVICGSNRLSWTSTRTCPAEGSRTGTSLSLHIACEPDPDDALAATLMGDELAVDERDNVVLADEWSGEVTVSSSAGWTAAGLGQLVWSDWDHASGSVTMDTVSLDLAGTVSLTAQ